MRTRPPRRPGMTALSLALSLASLAAPAGARNPMALRVRAPELRGAEWINTGQKGPLTLASLKGKVTVLHFWTFG